MADPQDQEQRFMRQALELAAQGVGLCSPNPCVGAVLVSPIGSVIGTGSHTYAGIKHAEVLALEAAAARGASAQRATLYINLEPCCHQGRTGPCADRLIAAGVSRVVAAMADPNPLVGGKGFERLRAAGIEVSTGLLQAEAEKLNEAFEHYVRGGTPLVTLKAGMTLDGKIAPPPAGHAAAGASGGWITSEQARAHVHELRHANDAIMVGVGTIIADDPLLTDRSDKPRRRPLLRVVLDSRLRIPLTSRVVTTAHNDLLVLCAFAEEKKRKALEAHGIRVEQVALPQAPPRVESSKVKTMPARRRTGTGAPVHSLRRRASDGRPDLRKVMARLGELEITSVLVEGGALVNWAALAAGVVDKVFLYYAPRILAGTGSVPFASGEGFQRMSDAATVKNVSIHHFGEDFAVEGYLRDAYGRTAGELKAL